MCVIIVMVMQSTLIDQLHVLLNPYTGSGQKGASRGKRTFKLCFLPYYKRTMQVDITKAT